MSSRVQELEDMVVSLQKRIDTESARADDLAIECEVLLTALRPFVDATNQTSINSQLTPDDWQRARIVYANSLEKK